jgi:predicted permease
VALVSAPDLALALRLVRKQPVLTLTAVAALATGIGLATIGFTFLDAVLWARLPFAGGDRFVLVDVREEAEGRPSAIEGPRFGLLRAEVTTLRHLGAFENRAQNLLLPSGDVRLVPGVAITPDSFSVLPYAPVLGRTLVRADSLPGAVPVVIIRESLWRRHFSSRPSVIGETATFSGVPRLIVGVMPDSLEFPSSPELWLPLQDMAEAAVFGVLANPRGLALAERQTIAVSQQYEQAFPAATRLRLRVEPFTDALSRGLDVLNAALVFVLVLVLLVIAANVANLVLARTLSRSSELAIRSALGASRCRLVAQVFTEVLLLGAMAAALGLYASHLTIGWIERTFTDIPFWIDFSIGLRTVLFIVGATLLASAVAGALPALRATRRNTAAALAESTRGATRGFGAASSAMIALQIALSIAALQAALVVARGVAGYMEGASVAGESQVITARVYAPEGDAAALHRKLLDALTRWPSVRSVGLSTSLPRLSPPLATTSVRTAANEPESAPREAPHMAVSQGFLELLGGRPSIGRLFVANDFALDAPPVAIVNQPFVQKFHGGANPLGRLLRTHDPEAPDAPPVWREIVGVVPDLGLSPGDAQLAAGFYTPMRDETMFYVALAVGGDLNGAGGWLRQTVAGLDATAQVRDIRPLPDVGREDRAVFAGIGGALTALGAIALLLSIIGVYAMLSFSVTQRTRELAIRAALGATRADILKAVLARTAAPLVAGAAAGPAVGSLLVSARGIFAFRLPADAGPWSGPLLAGVMIAAAAIAAFVPARRALRISTADALRAE